MSQFTTEETVVNLNAPLPLMPAYLPVPPRMVTVPAEPEPLRRLMPAAVVLSYAAQASRSRLPARTVDPRRRLSRSRSAASDPCFPRAETDPFPS